MATQFEKRQAKEKAEATDSKKSVAKKIDTLKEQIDNIEYTNTAIDVIYNKKTKKFEKVTIEYNIAANAARIKDVKNIADSLARATYEFEQEVARKMLLGKNS